MCHKGHRGVSEVSQGCAEVLQGGPIGVSKIVTGVILVWCRDTLSIILI